MWREGIATEKGKRVERYSIQTPIWNGRRVGIAVFRAKRSDIVEVKVQYRQANGEQLIRQAFRMESARILGYPRHFAGKTELCIVPLSDMEMTNGHASKS